MKRKTKAEESQDNIEEKTPRQGQKRDFHWGWVPRLFVKPRSTLAMVNEQEKAVWMAPVILLVVAVLVAVVVAAPIKRVNIQTGATLPEDFQWWSLERQQQFLQAQQNLTSPTFMYFFPFISGLAGYLIVWLLCSSLLYLSLTLAGSRTSSQKVSNLIAWAMLSFVLREIVKTIAIIATKRLNESPGVSYLIADDAEGVVVWIKGMLRQVDFYASLFAVLVFLGAVPLSGLKVNKAALATAIALLLMLLLAGLPSVVSSVLSGMGGSGFYYF